MSTTRGALLCALAIASAATAAAQPAARVADLTTSGAIGSAPSGYTAFGGAVYFRAKTAANGYELWRTDGTHAGTWLVEDLTPGPDSSSPSLFTVAAGRLFFSAAGTLWASDGTSAGTARVRADLRDPKDLVALDGLLYFSAEHPAFGRELWRTDGTPAGTWMVKDILPGELGSEPWYTVVLNGVLYFGAIGAEGDELWTSDGTEAGTVLVRDIQPGPLNSTPLQLTVAGDTLFFTAYTLEFGRELWRSDGTAGGTALVRDIWPGKASQSTASTLTAAGSKVYFSAYTGETETADTEPWVSDGTLAGTFRLRDVRPGPEGSGPVEMTAVGSAVYFTADDGTNGREVWRSDGMPAGTVMVGPLTADTAAPFGLEEFAGALFFSADDGVHGRELWRVDGTSATRFDLNPGPLHSTDDTIVSVGTALYLSAPPVGQSFPLSYGEPWISDGTLAGTRMVRALETGPSSPMSYSIGYAGAYYFLHERPETGFELWRTDGTAAGTSLFIDLLPGPGSGFPAAFLVHGGLLYFSGRDATGAALFRTDGTAAGTSAVKRFPDHPPGGFFMSGASVGSRIFFTVDTAALGLELWSSDGTEAGTAPVVDLCPGPCSAFVGNLVPLPGRVVFTASTTGPLGLGVWSSDGTPAGTVRLTPASPLSFPSGLVAAGGRVFFVDRDAAHGREPWVTDGTPADTRLLADIAPGPGDSAPFRFTPLASRLIFTASDGVSGFELWQSDGTSAGTSRVADIAPGTASSSPEHLTAGAGFVFFSADDGVSGREPWRTDGTAAGTFRLADACPGADGSMSGYGRGGPWNGLVVFPAAEPGHGAELWRTDGTSAGTWRVQEIGPGEFSAGLDFSTPGAVPAAAGGRLFFRAVDEAGLEPWSLLPDLSVADAAGVEGRAASFTVSLAPAVDVPVTVEFATSDLTAVAGTDYLAQAGTLTFAPGQTTGVVTVALLDDDAVEGDERFALTLTASPGAFLRAAAGLGAIADADVPPTLAVGDAAVTEGDAGPAVATFAVTRAGSTAAETTVPFRTSSGTAAPGADFVPASGTLTFAPGETTRTVAVTVNGDVLDEPDEYFYLTILYPTGAVVAQGSGRGTIRDDDGGAVRVRALAHGSDARADLADGAPDLYLLVREPGTSYEVVLDEASGDLGADGPALERVAGDLSTVLQSSVAVGTGSARSLRIENGLDVPALDYVRVRSTDCTSGCGQDDVYRLRVRETTGRIARFNALGQVTVLLLQNRTDEPLSGNATYWSDGGQTLAIHPFALPGRGVLVLPTPELATAAAGSLTVTHDGPYGALAGKTASVLPSTGMTFETPLVTRPR